MSDKINSNNKPGAIIIEGHVQGLSNARALGEMGISVYVVDRNDCIAKHSKYCKKFFLSPDFEKDEFVDFLIELAAKESICNWVLIPSNDHAVYTLAKHKGRLEEHFKLMTPNLEIIDRIYDKSKLLGIAQKLLIPVPMTQLFDSVYDQVNRNLRFPLLIKGRYGLSFYKALGKKAFIARNERELISQLQYIETKYPISKTLTQELIPLNGENKTISFTAFCENGNIKAHWTGIKLREHPAQFGTATYASSTYVKECHRLSEKLLKILNYNGVCEVEYIQDPRDNQFKLIEVNPRTWLWVSLAKASGINYAVMIYDYLSGKGTQPVETDSTIRYWMNPITDTVFSIIGIMKGKVNPISFINSHFKANTVNALFIKGDLRPGFFYLMKIFKIFHNR